MDTKDLGLKIQPTPLDNNKMEWKLTVYSDSDWAADMNTRRSVTGFTIFLQGVPVLWKSQSQKTVSLSSSEAEYYAMSEAVKEIKFITQVLESVGLKVQKPIIVNVDNVGAIFVAENHSATKHTRHVDARYHFVREFIINGQIKIIFVKTSDNKSDIFIKNITSDIYDAHMDNFLIHCQAIQLSSPTSTDSQLSYQGGGVRPTETRSAWSGKS
jgi:hypothetical protein